VLLVHLASSARRAARIARSGRGWVEAVSVIVPAPVVRLAAAEGRLLHMALFRWGGPPDAPAGARAFAYHRHLAPTCTALLVLQVIEIGVYHIFVGHWNRTAAIVLFVVSDLGLVYLVGLIKSFRFRPVLLTADGVRVRAGILIDTLIPFDQIAGIEPVVTGPIVHDPATCNAALLAWPNVVLNLTRPLPRGSWRRRRPLAWRIAFRLDEPEPFLRLLAWRIGQGGPLA
jgi:hypothetical protein